MPITVPIKYSPGKHLRSLKKLHKTDPNAKVYYLRKEL